MKTNILFMLLGAALMFAVMQLFKPSLDNGAPIVRQQTDAQQATAPDNAVEADVTPKTTPARLLEADLSLEDAPEPQTLAQEENSAKTSVTMEQFDQQVFKQVTDYQVRQSKKHFRKFLKDQPVKLQALTDLARKKIEQETALFHFDGDTPQSEQDINLYSIPESELTAEQLSRQQEINEQDARHIENAESLRIEYADAVRNLLSKDELREYRQQEAASAQQQLYEVTSDLAERYIDDVPGLNDYQRSEINRLSNEIANQEPREVPIGATLGNFVRVMNSQGDGVDQFSAFILKITGLLTDEQRKAMENDNGFFTQAIVDDN